MGEKGPERPKGVSVAGVAAPGRTGRRTAMLAVGMAVASMTSVQSGVSLSVPVMSDYGVLSTSGLRLCWASLVLLLIARPPLHRFTGVQWRAALLLGCAMATMTLSFFMALDRLPQHLAVALEFCGPLSVAALGVRGWRALAWPLLAAAGILLLVLGDVDVSGAVDVMGIGFALLAAVGWGVYIVKMKSVGQAFRGFQGIAVSSLVAAVISLPFSAAEIGSLMFPWRQLLWTAGLAVFSPLASYILEMLSLRRLPSATFGVLMSMEPAIGACAGWIILGQWMTAGQMLGTALVVAASVGVVRAAAR